jgi:uncharacterized protein (TIGR03435 family)
MSSKIAGAALLLIAFMAPWRAFGAIPSRQNPSSPVFEVATIKPTPPDFQGRYMTMQGAHQYQAKGFTVKALISAAYNLPPRAVSGGPDWIDLVRYDILAGTPGESRPAPEQQMAMLRTLLTERFSLALHTEPKEFPVYVLSVAKGGSKLKESAAPDAQPALVSRVYPADYIQLPARNATMEQFAATLTRAIVDRPVLDRTGLTEKYDFDLEWTYDDSQFGGNLPPLAAQSSGKPDLFAALQQVGLKLESTRAAIDTIVIDSVQRPSEN